ncbi:NDP-glycosyltransferase YjiC-like [Panonychus citri]|uniref:NDP-glycosyltransferase YjiC-like n=1 Tax=Panonychus citri TaxID=50023 RepID=UPI0023083578|nr:NDP-glycosyltransferase YjiC-like [Panonychus citri]
MPSYRIMISAIDAFGHINALLGFSEGLKAAGHEIFFAHRNKHKHLADKRGFEFIPLDESLPGINMDEAIFQWIDMNGDKFRQPPLERYQGMDFESQEAVSAQAEFFFILDKALDKVVTENSFDLIVVDIPGPMPFLYKHSIPWIPLASLNPLILYPKGPPPFSGYSVNSDPSNWSEFKEVYQSAHQILTETHNKHLEKVGLGHIKFDPSIFVDNPAHFGFYHYPGELDYDECPPRRDNWIRVDAWIRQADFDDDFQLPEQLKEKPGKLVYFSLGSLGSADLVIMKKLIAILAKSPNKFIVSKGPRGDQLELADNMWGQNYVNQIKVVQSVDLVITHGGNNTFLETLYYGKPMIVIPYFYDQLDNAQRVVDKNIGFRVNTYDLDEDYFLDCIEKALTDQTINQKVKSISQNMRQSTSLSEAVKKIEKLIEETKNSTKL